MCGRKIWRQTSSVTSTERDKTVESGGNWCPEKKCRLLLCPLSSRRKGRGSSVSLELATSAGTDLDLCRCASLDEGEEEEEEEDECR